MILLYYPDDQETALCDWHIEKEFQRWLSLKNRETFYTSNELMITRARLGLARGEISSLTIEYERHVIHINPDGSCKDRLTDGFCDLNTSMLLELFDYQGRERVEEDI